MAIGGERMKKKRGSDEDDLVLWSCHAAKACKHIKMREIAGSQKCSTPVFLYWGIT